MVSNQPARKARTAAGFFRGEILVRVEHVDVERLDQVAELHQHAAGLVLLEPIGGVDLDDHAVDLLGPERRGLRGGGAERRDGETFVAPALSAREFLRSQ